MKYSFNLDDFSLKAKNKSRTFTTGKLIYLQDNTPIKIIGQSNNYYNINGSKAYNNFIIQFPTGLYSEVQNSALRRGSIKDPFKPSLYNIGFLGVGPYTVTDKNKKENRTYILWKNMLRRCYYNKGLYEQKYYMNCVVHKEWHNYQVFCKDIKELKNYDSWLLNKEKYELDKDYLKKDNAIYSKETCLFLSKSHNLQLSNNKTITI